MLTIQEYLNKAANLMATFLNQKLPLINNENWWQTFVLEKLTESQLKAVDEINIKTVHDLDLAALLTIYDKNWRELTLIYKNKNFKRSRNLIFELKSIRNHYAHEPSTGTDLDQKLRDCDSINRFLIAIEADETAIREGQVLHRELMRQIIEGSSEENSEEDDDSSDKQESSHLDDKKDVNNEDDTDELELSGEIAPKGVPVRWLKAGSILDKKILASLGKATYVGIDFGTSTSVASIASVNTDGGGLNTKTIDIRQMDELGREIHSPLIDSCLAWINQQILFGVGAGRLKQELIANKNIWTSFKMGLGVDLGPEYNRTALPEGKHQYTIEKPQHAAALFLKMLCDGIREYVKNNKLPEKIYYTVTVPASFETNQRNDLFRALAYAGIPEAEISLLDEPNAAFLSYLIDMESRSGTERFIDLLSSKERTNVMVFDFGAGTCDISILQITTANNCLLSRNLGISKFYALGGDDIDKLIAEEILLPQLCGAKSAAKYIFTTNQLETLVLPHLKSSAEALKIACCERAEQRGWSTLEDLRRDDGKIVGKPTRVFTIQGKDWKISQPEIKIKDFSEIMAVFVGKKINKYRENKIINILEPVNNSLEKVELKNGDIDMLLFIGGSCENPIIRNYVTGHMGRFVESITPQDLRAHVSRGAALYTLLMRGAGIDPIKPITSESIYVLTEGKMLTPVIKAGSPVPSNGKVKEELIVLRDDQKIIDLPFFAGSINKPVGFIQIKTPPKKRGFSKGEQVKISWEITREKILHVEAEAGGTKQSAIFQNPLANEELNEEVLNMLKAKSAFNKSILDGNGRPSVAATVTYANSAAEAQHWRLAAEMLEAAERLTPGRDHAINICYYYSMDGDDKKRHKWARIAYERNACAITAYNLALSEFDADNKNAYCELMEESLLFDPNYTAALVSYGTFLKNSGDTTGVDYLERAIKLLKEDLSLGILNDADHSRFRRAAQILGKTKDLQLLEKNKNDKKNIKEKIKFNSENLVGSKRSMN